MYTASEMAEFKDKENIGSQGSSKSFPSIQDDSPASAKNTLKPISPNRIKPVFGKLTSLENESLEQHFSVVHSSHENIQGQLSSLEYQTKQMGVDLGQLCDRSKNNNQSLGRLLDNISRYSEEVITEGNATKNDITAVQSKLNEIQYAFENIDLSKVSDVIDTQVSKLEKSFNGVRKEESSKLKNEILSIVEKGSKDMENLWDERLSSGNGLFAMIDRGLKSNKMLSEKLIAKMDEIKTSFPTSDVTKQIIDPLVSSMKNVSLDEESRQLMKEVLESVEAANVTYQKHGLQSDLRDTILTINPALDELKESVAYKRSTRSGEEVEELQVLLNRLEGHVQAQSAQMKNMNEIMSSQQEALATMIEKAHLQDTKTDLVRKIKSLEDRYVQLKDVYVQKYEDLKSLRNEYEELYGKVNTVGKAPDDGVKKLSKIRELQRSNTKPQDSRTDQLKAISKRVMSTPTKNANFESPFTIYNDYATTSNNSDGDSA